ncbi:MAG: subtilisin-like proprotein convertase family protein [Granulosicoccus sp.]|jgi:subtilisin-like proprotein convertase family protein
MRNNLIAFVLSTVTTFCLSGMAMAQVTYEIAAGGTETIDCGFEHTLTDGAGNYSGGVNQEITFCPDFVDGHKVVVNFTDEGVWDVHASDSIYIYDGPDTGSPLIYVFNTDSDPGGFTTIASFDNPSGCLTVVFVSDGADEAAGFEAEISCGYPCQPSNPIIASDPPSVPAWPDTGYIDICLGDTVWMWADAEFPHSPNNGGTGYFQSLDSSSADWDLGLGSTFINIDSVMFVPPIRAGYLIEMTLTDSLGCIQSTVTKIRVSREPIFSQLVTPGEDTICLGETTILSGGIVPGDTVAIDPGPGYFLNSGGVFAGTTFLPDGGGVNYETVIEISDFDLGMAVTSIEDIAAICVTMEHSWLGDLEMMLTCPNGTSVNIFNSNSGGAGELFPGGFGGGGTFLGDANDDGSLDPGVGWEYCFSPSAPWGTLGEEFGVGNTVAVSVADGNFEDGNSMTPGFYQPEGDYNDLIGCPLNGDWTLTIRDNLSVDNGYIFEWGILLSGELDPNVENYAFALANGHWLSDPIATVLNDTAIMIAPTDPGSFPFTFVVEDIIGCLYDTVINVYVPPALTSFSNSDICSLTSEVIATTDPIIGTWTWSSDSADVSLSWAPDSLVGNPTVTVNEPGLIEFIYESACGQSDTMEVFFNSAPDEVVWEDALVCIGEEITLGAGNEGLLVEYNWSPSILSNNNSSETFSTETGFTVSVEVTNDCGTVSESAEITVNQIAADADSPIGCDQTIGLNGENLFDTGGEWSYTTSTGGTADFSSSATDLSPEVEVTEYGVYNFTYTEDQCDYTDEVMVEFSPGPRIAATFNDTICIKDTVYFDAGEFPGVNAYNWVYTPEIGTDYSGFETDSQIVMADNPGSYTVTASGPCGAIDSIVYLNEFDCTVITPQVFGPGLEYEANQFFNIPNLQFHPGNEVLIYNRWGKCVYEQIEYQDDPWTGEGETSGVFFYILTLPQIGEVKTGYVHLLSSNN